MDQSSTKSGLHSIRIVQTAPHPCAYLTDRDATTQFIDPAVVLENFHYAQLAAKGFRRSGAYIYRPYCKDCAACLPARIPAQDYRFRRSEKRTWNKNADIMVHKIDETFREEHFRLYRKYIQARHAGGGMDSPNPEQYQSMLATAWSHTSNYEFRIDQELAGVAITDHFFNGLSAVYTFFDPDLAGRSLGTYAILWQIKQAEELGLDWLYMGYWIKECDKMRYKGNFKPLQIYKNDQWIAADQA